jgi:hypothetical protein
MPKYTNDINSWKPTPPKEIDRLIKTLKPHLRKIKVDTSIAKSFVIQTLDNQNYNCILGTDCNSMYCWNAPKDKRLSYLKFEWGHLYTPRCRLGKNADSIDNLALMCNRCNNQIQSSRTLEQLDSELESKSFHLRSLLESL